MSKHGALKFVNGVLTWAPITTGKSTTLTTTPALSVDNYLSSLTPPSTPNSPALSSYLAPSIGAAAASTVSSATTTKTSEPATQPPPPWRCYYSGDLNPQLVEFNFNDLLVDPSLAQSSENPLGALGEAISRSIRPDTTRETNASLVKAVVLGGYMVEGQEALSYNLNIVTGDAGALANRLQMLYIRVPELTFLSDPYCSDNSFTPAQVKALVEMHPVAAVPNWVSTQPTIFAGSIVEIEFTQGFDRGIVKNILEEETDLQSLLQELSASGAFSDGGAGAFLNSAIGAPGDPGNCTWSNGAKAHTTTWQSTKYQQWNRTMLRNGLLEETGMLVSDSVSGAKLLPPAMEDFKRLAAAYAKKFSGKVLKGSGYRTYASQVRVRMERVTSGNPCGSGAHNAAGTEIGKAAIPGTSNHGWGAAVDLNRSDWEHGATKNRKKAGTSKHFRWINKFSKDFNFVFGVSGEHWHIDWMPFTKQVTGWPAMRQTVQTSWTSAGIGDDSISLV
jgi:hypothetical protein